jgi:hypothetical protein
MIIGLHHYYYYYSLFPIESNDMINTESPFGINYDYTIRITPYYLITVLPQK